MTITIGGSSEQSVSYKFIPSGMHDTGFYRMHILGLDTPSTAVGEGVAALEFGGTLLVFDVFYTGFGSSYIGSAHFQLSSMIGGTGAVVRDLTTVELNGSATPNGRMMGYWRATDSPESLTPKLARAIKEGLVYFNIDTAAYPSGEIRGLLVGKIIGGLAVVSRPGTHLFAMAGGIGMGGSNAPDSVIYNEITSP